MGLTYSPHDAIQRCVLRCVKDLGVSEFVLSNELVSMALAMVAEDPQTMDILRCWPLHASCAHHDGILTASCRLRGSYATSTLLA